jgi:hypothetical protein
LPAQQFEHGQHKGEGFSGAGLGGGDDIMAVEHRGMAADWMGNGSAKPCLTRLPCSNGERDSSEKVFIQNFRNGNQRAG